MSTDTIARGIRAMTKETTFRVWFYPLESFTEYDDGDNKGPYLCRETMAVRGPESDAVLTGTHIDYQIVETDYEYNIVASRNGENLELDAEDPDAFYAVKVLAQGLPGREEMTVGDYTDLVADPQNEFISFDSQEVNQRQVEQMVGIFQRWLQNKA